MKILSRYILRESIGPFFFGLAIITLVLIMDFLVDIMNLIIDKGLKIPLVIELFGLNLAWMLALSVPMAVLVAALMAFGRLSSDNEITACKACGLSFKKLLYPALWAGLALAIIMIWFNDRVLPESNHRARMLLTDITRKKPTWSLEENIFLDHFEGYSIRVKTVARKTSEISEIVVIQSTGIQRIITAKRGMMYFSNDGSMLMLEMEDGEILQVDPKNTEGYTLTGFEKQTIAIPGASSDMTRTIESDRGDREMTVGMMVDQNRQREKQIMALESQADSVIMGALNNVYKPGTALPGARDLINNAINRVLASNKEIRARINFAERNAFSYDQDNNSMEVEIYKKFSIPAACITFVLIGAPLGSLARKGGFATGIGLSLFFFIIYWAFLIGGEQLADADIISAFWAMWLPNIILSAAGIILIVLFVRQSTIVSFFDRIKSLIHLSPAAEGHKK
jgi:lipopolysaccharide export system permease protein